MNIYGIHGTQGVAAPRRAEMLKRETGVETKSNVAQRDEMQISTQQAEAAQNANAAAFNASEIRLDLVNRIRSEIAAGTYYSDEKFEIALNRMFDSFE
jgi:anti-sigma28 factor (negative regulator of flagellin synthesis)